MPEPTKALTHEEAEKLIQGVLGELDQPTFATKLMGPGDIGIVFRDGGGCEILSVMPPDMKGTKGSPLDMGSIAIRGMFAVALFKIAHNVPLMVDVLTTVSREFAETPPQKTRLDS